MAESLRSQGITSLRLDYRLPNLFPDCVFDLLAGVTYLQNLGHDPVVLVGHSFGGATVIAAGTVSSHVAGVASLSPQTYGARMVGMLSPRPLLVVHGKERHPVTILLRRADISVGQRAKAAGAVRRSRASVRGMP